MQVLVHGYETLFHLSNDDVFPLLQPHLAHVTDLQFCDNWWMHIPSHLHLCRSLTGRPNPVRLIWRLGQQPHQGDPIEEEEVHALDEHVHDEEHEHHEEEL